MLWNPFSGGKKKKKEKSPAEKTQSTIKNYITRIKPIGQKVPKQNKNSEMTAAGKVLLKTLAAYDKPRNAVAVAGKYLGQGKNPLSGAAAGWTGKETYTGSDMLKNLGVNNKYGKAVGGFAIDMATDPLSYMTLGTGSIAKGVLKGGATLSDDALKAAVRAKRFEQVQKAQQVLQKQYGATDLSNLARRMGTNAEGAQSQIEKLAFHNYVPSAGKTASEVFNDATAQQIRHQVTQRAGKGFSVGGKSLMTGEQMQNVGGAINAGLKKAPVIGRPLTSLGQSVAKSFDNSFVAGLDPGMRQLLADTVRQSKGQQSLADIVGTDKARHLSKLQSDLVIGGKNADEAISEIIEKGGTLNGKALTQNDWKYNVTNTPAKRRAWQEVQRTMNVPENQIKKNADLADLVNVYTKSLKGIGMKEKSVGITNKLVDQMLPGALRRDKETGDVIGKVSSYFPHTISQSLNQTLHKGGMTKNFSVYNEFAGQRKHQGMSIAEVNDLIKKRDANTARALPEGQNFLETSAVKALMTRQLSSNKMLADKRTVDMVLHTFGEPLSGAAEIRAARNAGKDIVVPATSVRMYNVGRVSKDMMAKAEKELNLSAVDTKDAKSLAKILEDNGQALVRISADDATSLLGNINMKMYAMPSGIAEKFNRGAAQQLNDGVEDLAGVVNKFYSVWKPLVTGLNAKYHLRNIASSGFNNFLDLGAKMFDPSTQSAAAKVTAVGTQRGKQIARDAKIDINGTKYTAQQIHNLMVEHGALNTFFLTDSNSLARGMSQDVARQASGSLASRALEHPWQTANAGGKAVGNAVEEYSRATNFIAHLKQGFTPEEAARITREIHFDYQDITEFEQGIKKILPFYTWARKNIPLQLEHLLNNPTPYLGLQRAANSGAEMTGMDYEDMPEYSREDFAVPYGTANDGRVKVFDAGLPVSDLSFGTKDALGMINPVLKVPLSLATNQNFLTGGSLNSFPEETAVKMSQGNSLTAKAIRAIPGFADYLEAHPRASTAAQQAISSTGVLNDINRYLTPPGTDAGTLQNWRDANNTPGPMGAALRLTDSNFRKYYDPAMGAQNKESQYARQLANVVQHLKSKGVEVPTVAEINKKKLKPVFLP